MFLYRGPRLPIFSVIKLNFNNELIKQLRFIKKYHHNRSNKFS